MFTFLLAKSNKENGIGNIKNNQNKHGEKGKDKHYIGLIVLFASIIFVLFLLSIYAIVYNRRDEGVQSAAIINNDKEVELTGNSEENLFHYISECDNDYGSDESDEHEDNPITTTEKSDQIPEKREEQILDGKTFFSGVVYTFDRNVDLTVKSCKFFGYTKFVFFKNSTVIFENSEFFGTVRIEYYRESTSTIESCKFFGTTEAICHRPSVIKFVKNKCFGNVLIDGDAQVEERNSVFFARFKMPNRSQ